MSLDSPLQRQQRLLIRSAALRQTFTLHAEAFAIPASRVDLAYSAWRWVQHHPHWPIGVVLIVAILKPRRSWVWGRRLWWIWGMVRRAQQLLIKEPATRQ